MSRHHDPGARIRRLWDPSPSPAQRIAALPLRGLAVMFRGAIAVRNLWWRRMAREAGIPVISVGNLTVGGNSKTPFALFIASRLACRNFKVGIISRGYGKAKSSTDALLIADDGELKIPIENSGDEPAMMARRFSGPIAVADRRLEAITMLRDLGPIDVVVLDDGFQHTMLKRDVDLLLVNRERAFGNSRMLPAGPMREPVSAIRRADAVIVVSSGCANSPSISSPAMKELSGSRTFHAFARPHILVQPDRGEWRETPIVLGGRRVLAVSGLADPSGFHAMIRELDGDLMGVLEYPDHHSYTADDWHEIAEAARGADLIITTEKDLIKLERFPFARDTLYALRLEVTMPDEDAKALDQLIFERIGVPPGEVSQHAH